MGYKIQLPPIQGDKKSGNATLNPIANKAGTLGTPGTEAVESDFYTERFLRLINGIRTSSMMPESLPWLAENHAALYRLLTVVLQDKLEELWDKRAPIGAFQFILDRIWDAHQTARELYAAYLAGRIEPPCDPKRCEHVFRTPTGGGGRG